MGYSTLFSIFIYNQVNIHDANGSGSSGTDWKSSVIWLYFPGEGRYFNKILIQNIKGQWSFLQGLMYTLITPV